MQILYLGDIMAKPGRETVKQLLPELIQKTGADFVVAQSENVSSGKGMRIEAMRELQEAGVDFFTGGNWSWHQAELHPLLQDDSEPVIRPANYPADAPGRGWQIVDTANGKVLLISLLGQIVGGHQPQVENPLKAVDAILEENNAETLAATIVNFHGDYSSEKLVIGQYLDGRVTAVIGDHWHVPTADAMVLPKGTAHITDVGMVGSLDSSLGIKTDIIVDRWLTQMPSRNELEEDGRRQLNAVLIESTKNGLAKSIEQIIRIV